MASDSIQISSHNKAVPASEEEQLAQVRSVLLGPQDEVIAQLQNEVLVLQERLQSMESRTQDTSEVLADAVTNANGADERLGNALKPIVIDKFHEASRDDPDTMADALFPILGPAVRKMIVNMITPDKSKKQFGYQVEQLFLIDKSSGIPVCHVASDVTHAQDADMVSGMLNAIQSFVQDAFETDEFDGLNTLQMGELSVWIEWGPKAVLAAVVRGAPPQVLRDALQIKIEQIHQTYESELKYYDGDTSKLAPLEPDLRQFIDSHDGSVINRVKNFTPKTKRILAVCAALFFGWAALYINNQLEQASWNEFLAKLGDEPGVVVTGHREEGGIYKVFGLRDEFSEDPAALLESSGIDRVVEFQLEPYFSVHSDFIIARARKLFNPPVGVELLVAGTTLYISGSADENWIKRNKPLAASVLGVTTTIFNVRKLESGQ